MFTRLLSAIAVLCAGYLMFGGYIEARLLYSPEHLVVEFGRNIGLAVEGLAARLWF